MADTILTLGGMAKAIVTAKEGHWVTDSGRKAGLTARYEALMVQWCYQYIDNPTDYRFAHSALELLVTERNEVK